MTKITYAHVNWRLVDIYIDIKSGKSTTARLSFGVQNALIISKYKGIDPEVFSGIDNVIYPRARMYVMNCNVNF